MPPHCPAERCLLHCPAERRRCRAMHRLTLQCPCSATHFETAQCHSCDLICRCAGRQRPVMPSLSTVQHSDAMPALYFAALRHADASLCSAGHCRSIAVLWIALPSRRIERLCLCPVMHCRSGAMRRVGMDCEARLCRCDVMPSDAVPLQRIVMKSHRHCEAAHCQAVARIRVAGNCHCGAAHLPAMPLRRVEQDRHALPLLRFSLNS